MPISSSVNDLATEYYCADDGMTWYFTIRDDAKFTDGEPLSASDVAFTINGIIESEAAEADLSMVEKAVATDDTHVEITMTKPYNALLYTLAVVGIVPEHAHGEDYGRQSDSVRAVTCLSSGIAVSRSF